MKILKLIFSRVFFVGLVIAAEIAFFLFAILKFQNLFKVVFIICAIITLWQIALIINSDRNPAYKMAWIIPMIILPSL
ncbi:MAG: hypothetical protein ACI4QE_01860, partial [Acutalibacteraceae bacterium]